MDSTTKTIKVNIPAKIQEKIDEGNYKLNGTEVRDKLGRIVCNLKSLDSDDTHYFSPHIFLQFENCTFISSTALSSRLHENMEELKTELTSIDCKIDRILGNQANNLIASISVFDELFESLLDGSSLTDEKKVFHAGVESAALLAANIESYLNDYINSTKVNHNNCSFNGETYLAYSDRKGRKPDITKSEFIKFQNHQANFFSYSFLKIINNINILSLTYDKKVFKRYNENLEAVKVQLLRILHILLRGIGGEIDAYEMCYTIREIRGLSDSYYKLYVERILKFDKDTSLNCLISRQFKNSNNIYYDGNRIASIYSIINILEDIDNLKHRSEQLEKLDLSELTEISEIKKILFKNKS